MSTTTRYRSVVSTLGLPMPAWVSDSDDQVRVAAYGGYQDMYDNTPDTFTAAMRGDNDKPIYIPGAVRIVETTNRYLGRDFTWYVKSASDNQVDITNVSSALATLAVREELPTRFYSLKRNMLIKGDAFFHITLNPAKPAGSRISLTELDPRRVFKIPNPENDEATDGYYIVDLIYGDDGKTQIARRLSYRKREDGKGGVQIFSQLAFFETSGWDDRFVTSPTLQPVPAPMVYAQDPSLSQLLNETVLPTSVQALPVYHVRNRRAGGEAWGTSEIAGLETLVVGLNQAVSDEDFTLALQGLGVYVTDSPRPVDGDGNETQWVIAPGTVLELRGSATKFDRVAGVGSVAPYQDHIKMTDQVAALPEVATGKVDAAVASSGVALRLEMAPILGKNEEKETELLSKCDQMFWDLIHMWLPQDGVSVADDITVQCSFSDPLPQDRQGTITEVTALVAAGLMSRQFAIEYLAAKLGYQFPVGMQQEVERETDEAGARIAAELGGIADATAAPVPGAAPTAAGVA
jgi:hypothetical protein